MGTAIRQDFIKLIKIMNEYKNDYENEAALKDKIKEIKAKEEILLKDVEELPDCFNELPMLKKLTIEDSEFKNLPESFKFLTNLTDLSLSYISDINTEQALTEISCLINLKRLTISHLPDVVIPESFKKLIKFKLYAT